MRMSLLFIVLTCFSFNAFASPIYEIKSFLPSIISSAYPNETDQAVSDELSEHEQDLLDYCMAETDKSEAECVSEIQDNTITAQQAEEISDGTGVFLDSYGSQHSTIMTIVAAAISALSTIAAFALMSGWKYPSNYLSLAANSVILIFYWSNLSKFLKVVQSAKDLKYKNQQNINQTKFINDQVEILKEAKPLVKKINTSMKVVIGISIGTVVAAIIESILCVSGNIYFCACTKKKKKKPFFDFINSFFPDELIASTTEELNNQKNQAKQTVEGSGTSLSVGAWRKVIFEIIKIYLKVNFTNGFIAKQIAAKIFPQSMEKAVSKILAFVKVVFYSLDLKNYVQMKNMYQSAEDEIDRRIELLKDFGSEIDQALSSESGITQGESSVDNNEGLSIVVDNQGQETSFLGDGSCTSFNYKTAEATDSPCNEAVTTFPKAKKPTNPGIKSLDSYMESLDPNPIFENISKATTTKEGVDAAEFSKNAKRLKKLIPKLLKVMKKKGIKFSKDQKEKKVKPLYLQIIDEGNKRNQHLSSVAAEILKSNGIKKEDFDKDSSSPLLGKRKAYDDKKNSFKLPEVDMGEEIDEDASSTDDDVDYAELNEYEDLTKDINKNKGASLWKIIKVRYKKSAWDDLLPKRKR